MTRPIRRSMVFALPAVLLASCGAGSSDSEKITSIIKDVGHHPADLCSKYATPAFLSTVGNQVGCLKAAQAPSAADPNVKVLSVSVSGSTAIAQIQGNTGKNTVSFTKVGGNWKVSRSG